MSIAGIRINQPFNNSALSIGGSLAEALIGDNHLLSWFQADARSVELEGTDIVAFLDRKGGSGKFTRSSSISSATLADGLFGVYSGARFNSSESDRSVFSGAVQSLISPFSWGGVATLSNNAASGNLLGSFTSSTVRAILNAAAGTSALRLQYGSATSGALPITVGKPFAFVCGYDGANIFLMVDGAVTSVAAAGAPGTAALTLGGLTSGSAQFWDGNVSDIFLCDLALNSPTAAAQALLSKIRNFTQTVYGLSA